MASHPYTNTPLPSKAREGVLCKGEPCSLVTPALVEGSQKITLRYAVTQRRIKGCSAQTASSQKNRILRTNIKDFSIMVNAVRS